MTTSRTIHDYLDGMLPADAEEHLFMTLAADAEARRELKGQIALHTAVRKDMATIAVPDDATAAIYSGLGFTLPVAGSMPTVSSVVSAGSSSWMPWSLRLGAVVLALWIGIEWRDIAQGGRTSNVPADITVLRMDGHTTATTSSTNDGAMRDPVRSDAAIDLHDARASSSTMTRRSMARRVHADGYDGRSDDRNDPYQRTPIPSLVDTDPNERNVDILNAPEHRPGTYRSAPFDANTLRHNIRALISPAMDADERTIDVQARALSTFVSTPSGGLPNTVQGTLHDFAVGAWYAFDEENDLGIEVGRQAFPQEFTRRVGNQDIQYRQTPELFWAGPSYRRQFRDWSIGGIVTPVGQTMIGWTQTGPTARAMVGLAITPERRLSMTLGIEGAWLWYPVQGRFYTTSMIGISYGLHYRF